VARVNRKVEVDLLLTPGEVAKMFNKTVKTISRWATSGELKSIKTLGGHRRFALSDVQEFARTYKRGLPK